MNTKAKILEHLEVVAPILPVPIYWADTNCVVIGLNGPCIDLVSNIVTQDNYDISVIGKDAFDIYTPESAQIVHDHSKLVMQTKKALAFEERLEDLVTGKIRYYISVRAPLIDDEKVVGVIGALTEITSEKEAEQLKLLNEQLKFENQRLELKNKTQKIEAQLEEHKKFRQIADQMAHDLGSPLMALSVFTNNCAGIPEMQRNMIKESASRIRDIAGSLLNQYKPIDGDNPDIDTSKEVLVYEILDEMLMNKQYEYHELAIKFEGDYDKDSIFSFIEVDSSLLKRMLSNLINNSVDAIEDKPGKIIAQLTGNEQEIKVSIIDTGKGMPESVVNRILANISFTSGKENGRGIGYTQIHETLRQSNGRIEINSQLGIGTTITLTFPKIKTPEWIAEEIEIKSTDIVVILDDDNSIHNAWDMRFSDIIQSDMCIRLEHFSQAIDVINFIKKLSKKEIQSIILLTDYDLLKQNLNGLDVVLKTKITRSMLVTSYYSSLPIIQESLKYNIKILPKVLAAFISIKLNKI